MSTVYIPLFASGIKFNPGVGAVLGDQKCRIVVVVGPRVVHLLAAQPLHGVLVIAGDLEPAGRRRSAAEVMSYRHYVRWPSRVVSQALSAFGPGTRERRTAPPCIPRCRSPACG